MDSLLQHPSAPPGPRHENPRYGVCFSGLTCAENGGSLHLGLRAPSQLLQAATPAAATQILVDRQLAFGTVVVGRGYGDARSRWRSHSLSGKRFTGAIGTARRAWVRSAPHGQWRQPRVCAVYGGLKVLNNQLVAYLVA
jgi:hypothetical protein